MAIPASDLVKIMPRVLAGAGQDLNRIEEAVEPLTVIFQVRACH